MKSDFKKKFLASFLTLAVFVCAAVILPHFFSSGNSVNASAEYIDDRYGREEVSPVSTYAMETINFTRRETEYVETTNGVPLYEAYLSNSCGPTAGAIIVGFYDKYYEGLIPGFTGYYPATGKYKKYDKTYTPQLMEELYTLMRTNVDDVGVSEADCLSGLRTYCVNKGYSVTYSSVASSKNVNTTSYINAIKQNKPVIIFGGDTVIQDFDTGSTYETVSNVTIPNNHVFVGYGYYTIKYYNGDNNFRTDSYLRVACGRSDYNYGFIRVASTSGSIQTGWFHDGYAVTVA